MSAASTFTATKAQRSLSRPGGVTGKGFKPGQSGNPGGRPKVDSLEALARTHTADAIAALARALTNPRERVPAAIALLDRGWGKPAQMVTGDTNRPLIVDFRWADNTTVDASTTIDAVAERAISVSFQDED